MNLPTGTITFLFTNIEGSTKLWERCPDAMRVALQTHDRLLRQSIEGNQGYVFKTVGDAFCAGFATASDALKAALDAHFALLKQEWGETGPIRVRMGIHTGDAEMRDGDYFGPTLNRVARLQGIAYGAQTLVSQATFELIRDRLPEGVSLTPLGAHRLKDLNRAEQVFQVICPGLPSDFPGLKSLDSFPNNLPIQMTSFIGREREMEDVKRLLSSHRLVTLLGPGGTGKTRLSLQVGADRLDQYPDGVWFVELAPISEGAQVAQSVAAACGIKEEQSRPISQSVIESLKPRTSLIVLDNCEHLLDSCARLTQAILQSCPNVTILASSREAFNISGETVYRVPPLRQPEPGAVHTADSLNQFEAVRLFIDRAVSINAAFAVTNENAPALAVLCARLDGIPLAIELAAARARSLSVEEINSKLDHCFRILTGGSRTALPRQQTLRALIDWSYDLLSSQEKSVLHRTSVFSGGWTVEAAESVCAGDDVEDWEVLDLLTSLCDKSLVVAEQSEEHTRYRSLETIRQYARDRLAETGEEAAAQKRHLSYFLGAAEINSEARGPEGQHRFVRLKREHDNLRSALDWALNNDPPSALRLSVALGYFYYIGGYLREGRDYLERALAAQIGPLPDNLAALAYFSLGRVTVEQGDTDEAEKYLNRSIDCANLSGNKKCVAGALNSLGLVAINRGDFAGAKERFERSLAIQQEAGNKQGIAAALSNLGSVLTNMGDVKSAYEYLTRGLDTYRDLGDQRGVANGLYNLASLCAQNLDPERAKVHCEEMLVIARAIPDDWYTAYALSMLAANLVQLGELDRARLLAEEGVGILRGIGDIAALSTTIGLLGHIAIHERRFNAARDHLIESLTLCQAIRLTIKVPGNLESFAELALAQAGPDLSVDASLRCLHRAAALLGAAGKVRAESAVPLSPNLLAELSGLTDKLRARLEPAVFDEAFARGSAMDLEQAISFALEPDPV